MFADGEGVHLLVESAGDGRIVDANPAAGRFYGHRPERLRAMTVVEIDLGPAAEVRAALARAHTGRCHALPRRHRLASGAARDVEVHASPIIVAGRRLLFLVVHDITDRRPVEEALRESEARFRDIVAASSDWFWETGPDLRFTFVSDRFFDLMRLDRDAVVGRCRKEVVGDSLRRVDPEGWVRHCDDLDRHRSFRDLELPIIGRDGRLRHIKTSGVPVFGADGGFRGYRGSGTDVTELKRAEEELRRLATTDGLTGVDNRRHFMERAEAEFARAQRFGHPFAAVLIDLDHFKRINDGHGHAVGDAVLRHFAVLCRREVRTIDLVGRIGGEEFAIVLIETDAAGAAETAERLRSLVAQAPVHLGDAVITVTASFGVVATGPADGVLEGLLARGDRALYAAKHGGRNRVILADPPSAAVAARMTLAAPERQALVAAREEAERISRAKSEFLAAVSHELRTPLNAVIGFSEIMELETFGPFTDNPRYRAYMADIRTAAQHLLDVINGILDICRIEAGKCDLRREAVDVAAIAEECLRLVALRAEAGGVALAAEVPPNIGRVSADRVRLRQILLNLLANAIRFTPPEGHVSLAATRVEDGHLFTVADDGIGMNAADIEIALTPFGQVDGGTTRKHDGTGLGLPLARKFVEIHGGWLTVESQEGHGTTVAFWLPDGPADSSS